MYITSTPPSLIPLNHNPHTAERHPPQPHAAARAGLALPVLQQPRQRRCRRRRLLHFLRLRFLLGIGIGVGIVVPPRPRWRRDAVRAGDGPGAAVRPAQRRRAARGGGWWGLSPAGVWGQWAVVGVCVCVDERVCIQSRLRGKCLKGGRRGGGAGSFMVVSVCVRA